MEETIMSNDNKELKNNELCEDKQEARQLTEEELEQVTGGVLPDGNKPDGVLPGNDKIGIIGEEYSIVGELPAL